MLIAAEIESYLEAIVMRALDAHFNGHRASFMSACGASEDFCGKVAERQKKWANNHNTSWAKVGAMFEFVGMTSKVFPPGFWDDIDGITHERGSIVHQGVGLRQVSDPRDGLERIERFISALHEFDQTYHSWVSAIEQEILRLSGAPLTFPQA